MRASHASTLAESGTNASGSERNGMKGRLTVTAATTTEVTSRPVPGRLRSAGRRVRRTSNTASSVRVEPTNHPDRNSAGPAWNTRSSTANVSRSKAEQEPERDHEVPDETD